MERNPGSFTNNFQAALLPAPSELDSLESRVQRRSRRADLAALTAEKIRTLPDCRFSRLGPDALAESAAAWYEGCSEAMFDGHHTSLSRWLENHSDMAAENGFDLQDLLQLLRACRDTAVETERWTEDIVSLVDEVMNEGLRGLGTHASHAPWAVRAELHCPGAPGGSAAVPLPRSAESSQVAVAAAPAPAAARPLTERRGARRVRLELPIRVAQVFGGPEEVTRTKNVSPAGLHFVAKHGYTANSMLRVIYPYWANQPAANSEIPAEVLRLDRLPDGTRCVAIRLLKPLSRKSK